MNPTSFEPRSGDFFHYLAKSSSSFLCRLQDGSICSYSHATSSQNQPSPSADYLGEGVIHSIDGVPQLGLTVLHFWR